MLTHTDTHTVCSSVCQLAQAEELAFHLVKLQLQPKPEFLADCPTIPDDRHTLCTQQRKSVTLSGCARLKR